MSTAVLQRSCAYTIGTHTLIPSTGQCTPPPTDKCKDYAWKHDNFGVIFTISESLSLQTGTVSTQKMYFGRTIHVLQAFARQEYSRTRYLNYPTTYYIEIHDEMSKCQVSILPLIFMVSANEVGLWKIELKSSWLKYNEIKSKFSSCSFFSYSCCVPCLWKFKFYVISNGTFSSRHFLM